MSAEANNKIKIVFLGTPEFATNTLKKLHELKYFIPLVISQPDRPVGRGQKLQETPVKKLAQELSLQIAQPEKISKDKELIEQLKELQPDLMVTAAFGQILSQEVIDIPKWGIWNVHASLLPRWRGAAPINWAILEGDKETGITIMKTEKGLDTGPMLLKKSIPISADDTAISLIEKLSDLGAEALAEAIELKLVGKLTEEKQDESQTTYASKLNKDMSAVDWLNMTADEIDRKVRGLNPWPSIIFEYGGEKIKLIEAKIHESYLDEPLELSNPTKINKKQVVVKCKEGYLELLTVQPPNKKKIKGFEWLSS